MTKRERVGVIIMLAPVVTGLAVAVLFLLLYEKLNDQLTSVFAILGAAAGLLLIPALLIGGYLYLSTTSTGKQPAGARWKSAFLHVGALLVICAVVGGGCYAKLRESGRESRTIMEKQFGMYEPTAAERREQPPAGHLVPLASDLPEGYQLSKTIFTETSSAYSFSKPRSDGVDPLTITMTQTDGETVAAHIANLNQISPARGAQLSSYSPIGKYRVFEPFTLGERAGAVIALYPNKQFETKDHNGDPLPIEWYLVFDEGNAMLKIHGTAAGFADGGLEPAELLTLLNELLKHPSSAAAS